MASIFGFNLKSLKFKEDVFSASLYYENLRLGKIENNENIYWLDWVKKITEEDKQKIYDVVSNYFIENPKHLREEYGDSETSIIELVYDLVILDKLEKTFSTKKNRQENRSIIKLSYHKRDTEPFKKEKVISCRDWTPEYNDKIKNIYKPVNYFVYKDLSDFNVKTTRVI